MDYRLEQALNGPAGHHAFLDALMRDAATWAVPVFIAIVAAWFAVGYLRGPREERRGALTALLAAGGALLVNQGLLLLWSRPRPFDAHPETVHTLVARSADGSFPSDHAAASVAIATVLVLAHRRLGLVALAAAALVCVARVYVGAHYPGDVLAGAAVGATVAWLAYRPLGPAVGRAVDLGDGVLRRLRIPPRDRALRA
jgi:membrane-associated phospholipid phosphatase